MASETGVWQFRVSCVNPGKGGKYPFAKARLSVDMAGENSAACANFTKSAGEALKLTECRAWGGASKGSVHSPWVVASLFPVRTT